jgi:tol-pal system protein YbgF
LSRTVSSKRSLQPSRDLAHQAAKKLLAPLLLVLLGALPAGCASSGADADGDQIKELQDRVLELQRKAAVAEVELARLRQQVAELMAKQGAGGGAASGSASGAAAAPASAGSSSWRRPAPPAPAAPGNGARASAERSSSSVRPLPPPAGGATPPERPAGAAHCRAFDESDIEVPTSRPSQPSGSTAPRVAQGSPPLPPASPGQAASAAPPPGPSATGTPAFEGKGEPVTPAVQALYDRGYTLYHQRHYVDAEASFQRFLQAEPNSELADNAQYWIGECRYSRGDMRGALAAFREAVARYPRGNKTPDALLKAGMSLEALGDKEGARTTYQEVLRQFPGTAVAAVAEERRAKLP